MYAQIIAGFDQVDGPIREVQLEIHVGILAKEVRESRNEGKSAEQQRDDDANSAARRRVGVRKLGLSFGDLGQNAQAALVVGLSGLREW